MNNESVLLAVNYLCENPVEYEEYMERQRTINTKYFSSTGLGPFIEGDRLDEVKENFYFKYLYNIDSSVL